MDGHGPAALDGIGEPCYIVPELDCNSPAPEMPSIAGSNNPMRKANGSDELCFYPFNGAAVGMSDCQTSHESHDLGESIWGRLLSSTPSQPSLRPQAQGFNQDCWQISNSHASDTGLRRSTSSTSMDSRTSRSSIDSTPASYCSISGTHSRNFNLLRRKRKSQILSRSRIPNSTAVSRPFKCTFCCDTFGSKHGWSRHEKTLHLDVEIWTCCPQGGSSVFNGTEGCCSYRGVLNPDQSHLERHNHSACASRPLELRQFRRRDHLARHLRSFHKLDDLPFLDDWMGEIPILESRCGFCDSTFSSWGERVDHLAHHFRQGCTMKSWRGSHGFEEHIAARICNAVPPYHIANESHSPVPFSATSLGSRDHFPQIAACAKEKTRDENVERGAFSQQLLQPPGLLDSRTRGADAFASVLTSHLAGFARTYKTMGMSVSDEALQEEARKVLYSSEDP